VAASEVATGEQVADGIAESDALLLSRTLSVKGLDVAPADSDMELLLQREEEGVEDAAYDVAWGDVVAERLVALLPLALSQKLCVAA
jgi:hypothetical protein